MLILQWIVWGALAVLAAVWTFGVFYSLKRGGISRAMVTNVTVFWLLLVWTLADRDINKLHLLWLAPPVILLSNLLPTIILVVIYGAVLYFLG